MNTTQPNVLPGSPEFLQLLREVYAPFWRVNARFNDNLSGKIDGRWLEKSPQTFRANVIATTGQLAAVSMFDEQRPDNEYGRPSFYQLDDDGRRINYWLLPIEGNAGSKLIALGGYAPIGIRRDVAIRGAQRDNQDRVARIPANKAPLTFPELLQEVYA